MGLDRDFKILVISPSSSNSSLSGRMTWGSNDDIRISQLISVLMKILLMLLWHVIASVVIGVAPLVMGIWIKRLTILILIFKHNTHKYLYSYHDNSVN